jgi:hypothetical protein
MQPSFELALDKDHLHYRACLVLEVLDSHATSKRWSDPTG